jgi:hypothetical protein
MGILADVFNYGGKLQKEPTLAERKYNDSFDLNMFIKKVLLYHFGAMYSKKIICKLNFFAVFIQIRDHQTKIAIVQKR